MNDKRYTRFWLAVLIASIIISLMGCYTPAEVWQEQYPCGGVFVEVDTVIGTDTLYFWK